MMHGKSNKKNQCEYSQGHVLHTFQLTHLSVISTTRTVHCNMNGITP